MPPTAVRGARRRRGASPTGTGRYTVKRVPRPGSLSTAIVPPLSETMSETVDRPRPAPWPSSLVVKKGSKMRREIVGVDAHPVVGDGQRGVSARGHVARDGIVRLRRSTTSVASSMRPPFGIASRALTARLTMTCSSRLRTMRRGTARTEPDVVRHVLADERVQHAGHVHHDLVDVDDRRLQHVLAAERHEVVDERARPSDRGLDLAGGLASRGGRRLVDDVLAVADDGRQDVVEVVGDAPRQPAEGVHLPRGLQLPLQLEQLGAVPFDEQRLRPFQISSASGPATATPRRRRPGSTRGAGSPRSPRTGSHPCAPP